MTTERWQRIEELFTRASALDGPQRASFLAGACVDDVDLRREVETLLKVDTRMTRQLDTPALGHGFHVAGLPQLKDLRSSSLAGQRIGAYQLISVIASGGMGVVWKAERADDQYRKQVAIKLIKKSMVSDDLLRRFHHERQTLADLDHPNIAKLLDGGTTEDGLPYLVMEHIEGQPIDRYCVDNRLPIEARLGLFRQVCAAVHHAHQNLVVHRDLKPHNILINNDGTPKLLDFGISQLLTSGHSAVDGRREAPQSFLTPDFASPEQVRGRPITTASDIYSLGLILYRLLTDSKPFHFAGLTTPQILRAICEVQPPTPSVSVRMQHDSTRTEGISDQAEALETPEPPNALRRSRRLEGDLDRIVLKALHKDPLQRYTSVQEFSEDLRCHLEHLPVSAAAGTVLYRGRKFVRRHRGVVAATVLFFVALLAGIFSTTSESIRARHAELEARKISRFLQDVLVNIRPSLVYQHDSTMLRRMLDHAARRVDAELSDHSVTEAEIRSTLGSCYRSLGSYVDAERQLRLALHIQEDQFGDQDQRVAVTLNNLAATLHGAGKYAEAEGALRKSLNIMEDVAGPETPAVAGCLVNLAALSKERGDYAAAEQSFRRALSIQRNVFGNQHPAVATCMNNLALVLHIVGHFEEAEHLYRESADVRALLFGEDSAELAHVYNNLAALLQEKGELSDAERLYRQALQVRLAALGPQHPEVAHSLIGLASLLTDTGRHDQAGDLYRQAIELRRDALGDAHPEVAETLGLQARWMCLTGDCDQADVLFSEALQILQGQGLDRHWFTAQVASMYGECLTQLNRFDEAEKVLLESYPILRSTLGQDRKSTTDTLHRLVTLYDAWDHDVQADQYRAVLETLSESSG